MNAMKYNRILWIVLSILCIASCDDFLTEAPTTQLSEDTLFADEANMEASLVGVYNSLTGNNGSYTYSKTRKILITPEQFKEEFGVDFDSVD